MASTIQNIALIFGGKSAEHEVSLNSARNVFLALDKSKFKAVLIGISKQGTWYSFTEELLQSTKSITDQKLKSVCQPVTLVSIDNKAHVFNMTDSSRIPLDIAFPIMHGTYGEDGCIQGYFKMMNLPFVGCGVLASAIGMDKDIMKRVLNQAQIPNARYEMLTPYKQKTFHEISTQLGLPFFMKPANMGSSVGVHKIKSEKDFHDGLKDAFLYDSKVLVEEFIQGREVECSVMGLLDNPQASIAGEVLPQHEFYSYEAKYLDDKGATIQIPAELDANTMKRVQEMAVHTYQTLGCEGLTRVDFFLKANGELLINEVNTIPGFTKISMYPKMWEASGKKYSELITELLRFAEKKHQNETQLNTSFLNLE